MGAPKPLPLAAASEAGLPTLESTPAEGIAVLTTNAMTT